MNLISPKLSVIVLTLNSEKYISRCLDALILQSFTDFEVIVVDGGSNDFTRKLVEGYTHRLSIRFIDAPDTNMGQARNLGVSHSKAEYISYCDSDDIYLPQRLQSGIDALENNPDCSVSYGLAGHFTNDPSGKKYLARKINPRSGFLSKQIIREQMINIGTLTLCRKAFETVRFRDDEGGRYGEDWQYLISLCAKSNKFACIPEVLTLVDVRENSHTTWQIQHLMKWYVLQHLLLNADNLGLKKSDVLYWRYQISKHWFKFVFAAIVSNKPSFPVEVCKKEFKRVPILPYLLSKFAPLLFTPIFISALQKLWLANRRRKQKPLPKIH